jgi:peptidoglycan/LPS O-acetylase OafA/YrhL
MLGSIRFVFALCVMISHTPGLQLSVNIGVVAVICFYFISGFLMQKSYRRFEAYSPTPRRSFYIDRCIKLFPQYIIVTLLTVVCVSAMGHSANLWLMNQDMNLERIVLNLLLLPSNYVFQPLQIESLLPHPIVPPAWSLATEFHFYLLLPFIIALKSRHWRSLLLLCLAIQFSAFCFGSGSFNSDSFGYRFIFGVLTIFLYGMAYAQRDEAGFRNTVYALWMLFLVFLLGVGPATGIIENPRVREVLLGGVIILPLAYCFTNVNVEQRMLKSADRFLGDLAYPLFITHFLAFYLVEKLLMPWQDGLELYLLCSFLFSLAMSVVLHFMQNYIEGLRIKLRGFASMR